MQITLTLGDMLLAGTIVVPIGAGAIYWAVRMAIKDAVTQLELRVAKAYQSKDTCLTIRTECERHRHELAAAAGASRHRSG